MFEELERFVTAHRGELTSDVVEPQAEGYLVCIACTCGSTFERRVTPDIADADLLRSRLLAHPN